MYKFYSRRKGGRVLVQRLAQPRGRCEAHTPQEGHVLCPPRCQAAGEYIVLTPGLEVSLCCSQHRPTPPMGEQEDVHYV